MFNREDYMQKPNIVQISEYVNNPLFNKLYSYMMEKYNIKVILSLVNVAGNMAGTLNSKKVIKIYALYIQEKNYFAVMIVIGKKEKERFEEILYSLSNDIQQLYFETQEGNSQKWLLIELEDEDKRYEDVKRIIQIRSTL